MPKNKQKRAVVRHHICYSYDGVGHKQEDIVVPIFNSEHWILTQIQRRGKVCSKGFLDALKYFIVEREISGKYFDIAKEQNNPGGFEI